MSAMKSLRAQKGITQKEIAAATKVSVATVSRWEKGEFLPRADKLLAIAKLLDCKVDNLLEK